MLAVFLFIAGAAAVLFGLARRGLALAEPLRSGLAIGACGSLASMLTIFIGNDYVEGLPALAGWLIVGLGVSQCVAPLRPSRWLPRGDRAAANAGAP